MKIFTMFTKDGRVDVPIKDTQVSEASQIMSNPQTNLMDKVREMNCLSNQLTKAQLASVANKLEKVEFTDINGQTVTLIKGGPGSGRRPEGGSKETQHEYEDRQSHIDNPNNPFYPDPKGTTHESRVKELVDHVANNPNLDRGISNIGTVALNFKWARPGNASHVGSVDTGKTIEAAHSILNATKKMAKDAGNAIQAIGKEEAKPEHTPEELAEFEKEKKEHPEFTDEQIWQIVADHAVEKGGPGSGRNPEGGSKDNVDRTRWNQEGQRINTQAQQGMAEVERALRENKPKEETEDTKLISEGYNPRSMNIRTNKSLDTLRNAAGKLQKGGPGSGCSGANCGRPSEGGSKERPSSGYTPIEGQINHAKYPEGLKSKTMEELKFIAQDAKEAIDANPSNPKAGYYQDEINYVSNELGRRAKDITPTAQDEVTNAPRHHSAESNAKFKEEIANRQVGQTIMSQLGGNKFRAMTGAKDFVHEDRGVSFKIPKAKDGINHVKVALTGADTYDVTFSKVRVDTGVKEVSSVKGIYNDQLQDIFREHTGLDTHL